jgi:hypothetical protein
MQLASRNSLAVSAWAVTAAFGAYFCMYAFRKPFTAADYKDWPALWGIGSYKVLLVACQVFGYTVSKFIGIKVISEMPAQRRAAAFAVLIGMAQLALVLFAIVPPAWGLLCMFLNGLPLGMVFGLVLGFLEGRKVTEALTAGLCASFILADGVVKSVGDLVLARGVSEAWMPAVAGAMFLLPQAFFVWMLTQVPPPGEEDVEARSERAPMNGAERWEFFRKYAPGLVLLVGVYLLLTVLRSLRSDFAKEMWQALGWEGEPMVFTYSETVVMVGVVLINGAAVLIVDNRRAFYVALLTCVLGFALLALGAVGFQAGWLGGFGFMVLAGLGLYIPYVAVHTTIFERLIALLRDRGNLGYLMYLADAFGYLGYVAVMVVKNFGAKVTPAALLSFFVSISWGSAVVAVVLTALAGGYFSGRTAEEPSETARMLPGSDAGLAPEDTA